MHFEGESRVHRTMQKLCRRLDELSVDYAIAEGMTLFFHGYRRFTEDVDLVVTREAVKTIHDNLEGLGYVTPFSGSKNLRDSDSGVRIEFIITGDYPGDGKPKPVAFPNPADCRVEIEGMPFLSLPMLIELKLASGMTNPRRAKDLVDVQELIDTLQLSVELAADLNPYVREKYRELWQLIQDHPAEGHDREQPESRSSDVD